MASKKNEDVLREAERANFLDLLRRWMEAESFWHFGDHVVPLHEETAAVLKAEGVEWNDYRKS